jgi:hypothetical protein
MAFGLYPSLQRVNTQSTNEASHPNRVGVNLGVTAELKKTRSSFRWRPLLDGVAHGTMMGQEHREQGSDATTQFPCLTGLTGASNAMSVPLLIARGQVKDPGLQPQVRA